MNFTIVLYDKHHNKYYKLSHKNKPIFYVEYYDNSFREIKEPNNEYNNIKYEETIGGLENIVDCNIKNIDIYKKYLKGIGNYKMDELTKIAEECNIKTMKNGKKKTKKVLYDEINMSKY